MTEPNHKPKELTPGAKKLLRTLTMTYPTRQPLGDALMTLGILIWMAITVGPAWPAYAILFVAWIVNLAERFWIARKKKRALALVTQVDKTFDSLMGIKK